MASCTVWTGRPRNGWGNDAKAFLKLTERAALCVPAATIVVSKDLAYYLEGKYPKEVFYIPNGVSSPTTESPAIITEKYGLKGN